MDRRPSTYELRWLGPVALFGSIVLGVACESRVAPPDIQRRPQRVIYGDDDRQDVYAYPDRAWASRVADFSVALMNPWDLDDADPTDIRPISETLEAILYVCSDERFSDQPSAAWCSGTLIAPDLVLTAGHCLLDDMDCRNTRFVFNYYLIADDTLQTITADDVYRCQEIIARSDEGVDFAVARLDREAADRVPASLSTETSAVPLGAPLVVSGCPAGLPVKIDDGGAVRDNRDDLVDYFIANLDTFSGSSGSGVFRQSTGELVGVLTNGEVDFVWDNDSGCYRSNVCDDTECSGEYVTYFRQAADAYCESGGVGLTCACGDGICDDTGLENSANCALDCGAICGDGVCNGGESPVDCAADCGQCGNGVCDPEEAEDGMCCEECGCEGTDVCFENTCLPDPALGDGCDSAVAIPSLGTQVFQNTTRTASPDFTGTCESTEANDRVYTFTLTEETVVHAVVDGYDSVLYLRAVCDDPESEIACNDDGQQLENGGSALTVSLDPGTYFLVVDGFERFDGTYTLSVSFAENESTCEFAVPVPAHGVQSIDGTNTTAGNDAEGGCGGLGPDRVYQFTTTEIKDVTIVSTGIDTVLYARTDCGDDTSEIECNDDNDPPGDLGSRISLPGLPPGTYYVFVDAYRPEDTGTYSVELEFVDSCPDADGDGVCDEDDGCPDDPEKVDAGTCGCGGADMDRDGDGAADCVDECPADPDKVEPGTCGCGVSDMDRDGDGVADCEDECPADPDKVEPGHCGCGVSDADSDRDGLLDCEDACPRDGEKTAPGRCGCGSGETDCLRATTGVVGACRCDALGMASSSSAGLMGLAKWLF